jgi:hypothetical protein
VPVVEVRPRLQRHEQIEILQFQFSTR